MDVRSSTGARSKVCQRTQDINVQCIAICCETLWHLNDNQWAYKVVLKLSIKDISKVEKKEKWARKKDHKQHAQRVTERVTKLPKIIEINLKFN